MPARFKFVKIWPAYLGLAVVAVAAQLVFNQAVASIGRGEGFHWTVLTTGFDFVGVWEADYAFLHGYQVVHWYGPGISNAWPPPHEVLFAPLGWLNYGGAHAVSILLTIVVVVGGVLLWRNDAMRSGPGTPGRRRGAILLTPLLLSAPVVAVVWVDQLQAAVGLAALSLAIWAQRSQKWWLVGIASAIGMIRLLNAIPVLCMLVLGGWGRWRQLATAVGAATAFMLPLLIVSYLWDHRFIADYIAGLTAYPYNGAPRAAVVSYGLWGLAALLVAVTVCALWLVRRDIGRPLDPGRAALGMSLTVAIAPVGGLYPGIFALPALIRLGQRAGFSAIPWIGAIAPWVVILLLSPWLLSAHPYWPVTYLSFLDYALIPLAYPLVRKPPQAAIAQAA